MSEKNDKNNKKDPVKIKLSTAILSGIILILLCIIIAMGVFIVSKNSKINSEIQKTLDESNIELNNDNNGNNITGLDNNSQIHSDKKDTIEVQVLNNEDELVKKLYSYVLPKNESTHESVYQNRMVTQNDISNTLKLATVYSTLDKYNDSYNKEFRRNYDVDEPTYFYKRDTIQDRAKEIFGNDVKLKDESLKYLLARNFEFKNGEYVESYFQGGGGYITEYTQNKLVKAEKKDNEIYLYDNYMYVENLDNMNYAIYCDSTKQKQIANNVSDIPKIDNFISKLDTYKHTFKKNEKNNYYWFSTEMINKY